MICFDFKLANTDVVLFHIHIRPIQLNVYYTQILNNEASSQSNTYIPQNKSSKSARWQALYELQYYFNPICGVVLPDNFNVANVKMH